MNAMLGLNKTLTPCGDVVTLRLDRGMLEEWQRNPLYYLAHVTSLSPEEAAEIAEVDSRYFSPASPAGLKWHEFDKAAARLVGALLMRLLRPEASAHSLSFAMGDAFCEAENARLDQIEAEREARRRARKALRQGAAA